MPAPVPMRKPRVPAQRRVPTEGGGDARLAVGELMIRTKVRRVEREEGAMLLLPGFDGQITGMRL